MIIKCVAYKNGKSLGDISVDDISDILEQEGTFVWLGLHEPNDILLNQIKEEFGLHELAIEDTRSAHQRPKLEEYGNSLFVVLHTASLSEQSVDFGETHIFVGTRFLVHAGLTYEHGFVDMPRIWRLDGKKKRAKALEKETLVNVCENCFCAYSKAEHPDKCPECGLLTHIERVCFKI